MRRLLAAAIVPLVCCPLEGARAQAKPPSSDAPRVAWAHVTYISGTTYYLNAGTKAGVREGTVLEVMRGASRVAELVVAYVSSARSSATVRSTTGDVVVGDSARFTPSPTEVAVPMRDSGTTASRGSAAPSTRSARRSPTPIRGRFGVRYLAITLDGEAKSTLTQPGLDVRLDGHNIGGSPVGVVLDVRAYRQLVTRPGSSARSLPRSSTRIYQSAVLFNPSGRAARLALGRQFSSAIAPIGLFDGVSLDVDKARWSAGGFSGTQPNPATFGLSGDVREHGGYVQLHSTPVERLSWSLTGGGVGSYSHGEIDREFAFVQGTLTTRWLSLHASQEVDVNRGWRADAERASTTPTALYANARVALGDAVALFGGIDSRRSVRLYRDFLTPETAFDDSFRQGAWGGVQVTAFANHLRLSGDGRRSGGGAAGDARSYTGMLALTRLTPLQLGVHVRATSYGGTATRGALRSASLEMNPLGRVRLEGTVGERSDRRASVGAVATSDAARTRWIGADADFGIGRSLYIMLSTYRETAVGSSARMTQGNVALSWRF